MAEQEHGCRLVAEGRKRHKHNCHTCFGCESAECAAVDGGGRRHKRAAGDPRCRPSVEQPVTVLPSRAAAVVIEPGQYSEQPERLLEFSQRDPAIGNLFAALGLETPERKFAFLDEVKSERRNQEVIGYLERTTERCAEIIYPVNPDIMIEGAAQRSCGHAMARDSQVIESLARTVINSLTTK